MTSPQEPETDASNSDAWREQCMLYLLGELAENQTESFEQRLASSPDLGEELVRQADLIARLACVPIHQSAAAPLPSPSLARATSHRRRIATIAPILAIASCIALIIFSNRPIKDAQSSVAALRDQPSIISNPSEELLIAQAWVDNQIESVAEDVESFVVDDDEIDSADVEEPSDMDATLSWMFIAVTADSGTSSQGTGATNDG